MSVALFNKSHTREDIATRLAPFLPVVKQQAVSCSPRRGTSKNPFTNETKRTISLLHQMNIAVEIVSWNLVSLISSECIMWLT